MVIGPDNKFISQRTHPIFALITAHADAGSLYVKVPNHPELKVPITEFGDSIEATIWKDQCQVVEQSKEASALLSDYLGINCRLVTMAPGGSRLVGPKYAKRPADQVAFADDHPFLIISQASLDQLNSLLPAAVEMNRFRPNIVVTGTGAYDEDKWEKIRIGDIILDAGKLRARCLITTIHQDTGKKEGSEPLRTLAKYRTTEKGVMFGKTFLHASQGTIRIGDEIEVLE
jgi:uncharacterized protein YcbX